MHRYEWTDDLALGDENLDRQHRELIDLTNSMLDASWLPERRVRIRTIRFFSTSD